MKQIAITSLAFAIALGASAQGEVKPQKPAAPPMPPVEKTMDIPLPPEAPMPPEPPSMYLSDSPEPQPLPVPSEDELNDDYKFFLKKNPSVRSLAWTKNSLIVRLKNGKEERYDLSNEERMKQAEEKYGEIPAPPPPPPVAPPPPKAPRKQSS